jgi:hypothetical protein
MASGKKSAIHVAVWIDGKTAYVSTSTRRHDDGVIGHATPRVEHFVESKVERTMRSTGGRHGHIAWQHQTVDPAVKNERRRKKEIANYLERVLAHFNPEPDGSVMSTIILAGPGETKKKLAATIASQHPEWPEPELKTTPGRLTTAQKRVVLFGSQRIAPASRKKMRIEAPPKKAKA